MAQQQVRPRYEVEKLEGTQKVKRIKRSDEGINEEYTEEVDAGYMVYFPAGHSVRMSAEELHRHGFDEPAELIDEDGEVVGSTAQLSLKRNVQRKVGASKRADTGSVDANQGA